MGPHHGGATVALVIPIAVALVLGSWHPLHASSAVVEIAPGGIGSVTIRAFADELGWARDSLQAADYLGTRFLLTGEAGRRIPLELVSVREDRDALEFVLRLAAPARCEGLRLWNGVLAERYADQVNLVQIRCGGRSRQLIFSAGEGSKAL